MRAMLRRLLSGLGAEVIGEAGDGRAALELLEAGLAAELVCIDWNMPVLNGLELVKALRAQPRFNTVRLLMVTSETSPKSVYEALAAGVDEYVMKPVTEEMLLEKLQIMHLPCGPR